jgi:MurNAc alpha-1-phosphate uridylyltransferase
MITISRTAMVLAAGFGKRMGRLTQSTPKPLLSIGNTNCLEISVLALVKAGFQRIIINTHYLSEQIVEFSKRFNDVEIIISFEPQLLETAGGVRKVLHEFENKNFVVVNADMYWLDTDPSIIVDLQKAMQADDHFCLGVVPLEKAISHPGVGDFIFENGFLQKPQAGSENASKFVYMGVQIINPKIIAPLVTNAPMSLAPLYFKASSANKLRGSVFKGLWVDVGSPDGLEKAKEYRDLIE